VRWERRPRVGRVLTVLDRLLHGRPVLRDRAIDLADHFPAVAAIAQGFLRRHRAAQRERAHVDFDAVTLRRTNALAALAQRARDRKGSA